MCGTGAAAPALAQTKTVKGSVTNVGASSITVKVAGKDMTFNVDDEDDRRGQGRQHEDARGTGGGEDRPGDHRGGQDGRAG